jgi:hypothetical protein
VTKPKPIEDPTQGQHQVVISFRYDRPDLTGDAVQRQFQRAMGGFPGMVGLDVAVREVGAQGERGADEGRWDRPAELSPGATRTAAEGRSGGAG